MIKVWLKHLGFYALLACATQGQSPAPEATPTPDAAVPKATIISETTEKTPEFGPVVSAYLSYLEDEQTVTDDRASQREISPAFYRRNTNRISALRSLAWRLARASQSDYMPEMVAVARDEFRTIFFQPPKPQELRVNDVYADTFRFLGTAKGGNELFFVFARLDPYEQEEWLQQKAAAHQKGPPKP